jgi:HTH-type transcriptional regulator / antitoxin MqsA
VCGACGERFYAHQQALASDRARAGALRRHEGLLPPDEIRAIRGRYGLTQDALERLIRVGPKTVVRWERGTVCQSAAVDTLLGILRDEPAAVARLAARAGVPVRATRRPRRRRAA